MPRTMFLCTSALRRLIEELKKRFDVRYELPDLNLETLMEAFPTGDK